MWLHPADPMTAPARVLPVLDHANRGFWTSGRDGQLRLRRCAACRYWVHPPRPACPACHRRRLAWEPVSGFGTLFTYTVNNKSWNPDVPVPYLIGIVELPEQDGLRLTTNLVNCTGEDVRIGMSLRVVFEQQGEHWVPLFEPA